jgi:hypothetical protein
MALIDAELSEPYSIFTYRYFINNWRQLCFLVRGAALRTVRRVLLCPTHPRERLGTNVRDCRAPQAFADGRCVGAVVCKLDTHRGTRRGYVAMLVVDTPYRKFRIGACADGWARKAQAAGTIGAAYRFCATAGATVPCTSHPPGPCGGRHGARAARAVRHVRRRSR